MDSIGFAPSSPFWKNFLPTQSNNSSIPEEFKAETILCVALIDFAYSAATSFLTNSCPYRSFLLPTTKIKILFKSTVCFTSLYKFFKLLKESTFVIS